MTNKLHIHDRLNYIAYADKVDDFKNIKEISPLAGKDIFRFDYEDITWPLIQKIRRTARKHLHQNKENSTERAYCLYSLTLADNILLFLKSPIMGTIKD